MIFDASLNARRHNAWIVLRDAETILLFGRLFWQTGISMIGPKCAQLFRPREMANGRRWNKKNRIAGSILCHLFGASFQL